MQIGIIGAGTMGAGIAQAFAAQEKYTVLLCDMNIALAKEGLGRIAKKLDRAVSREKMTREAADALLSRITPSEIGEVGGCALVIEAAIENMAAKKSLFDRLRGICPETAILASNTSSLSITEMGDVVGMHFFNPAETMKLVEVIAGLKTPPEKVARVKEIAQDIGKTPVEVQEAPGFVVNRLLVPMINEAVGIYADGIASVSDIDTAMKLGANHPMGPLALADLIGLDVCLAIMEVLQAEFGDDKYRPHPLLRKMVRAGRLGRKAGEGFYQYA